MTVYFQPIRQSFPSQNNFQNKTAAKKNISFGTVLTPNNHIELKIGDLQKLVGKKLPEGLKSKLEILLGNNRVFKYVHEPKAARPEQFVLGMPGVDEFGHPRRTYINKITTSSDAEGSGTSIIEGLASLVRKAKEGTLVDSTSRLLPKENIKYIEMHHTQTAKIDGQDLPEELRNDLNKYLGSSRVLKFVKRPDDPQLYHFAIGMPGLNKFDKPHISTVNKIVSIVTTESREAKGTGNSVLEGISNLIQTAKDGKLVDKFLKQN